MEFHPIHRDPPCRRTKAFSSPFVRPRRCVFVPDVAFCKIVLLESHACSPAFIRCTTTHGTYTNNHDLVISALPMQQRSASI
eukprot:SAG22_NODE_18666_length_283_cov_0.842391_1_plen_81_part_01